MEVALQLDVDVAGAKNSDETINRGTRSIHASFGERDCQWTVVTSGARTGVHEGGTDDQIDFALSCDAQVLDQLLEGRDVDLQPHLDQIVAYLVLYYGVTDAPQLAA